VLKYLTQQHQVTLASFVRDEDKPEYIRHLETLCERVITVPITRSKAVDLRFLGQSLASGEPWMMLRDKRPEMRRVLADLAAGTPFDVVHADQLNMGQYALPFEGSRKVLDLHNALWMLYRRMADTTPPADPMKYILMRDWRLLKRYEGEMCRQFDAVTAVTEEDRQLLIEAGARRDIRVIPIAIDTDEQAVVQRRPSGPHIIHIGTMYWPPNIAALTWFLEEIYPLIKAQVPDVRCTLIGSRPPESLIQRSQTDRTLTITGYVDDPTPFMEDASMMIVPLLAGGGMRVKILNALSQGIPMVSTSIGCEGIRVEHGKDILIADTPENFAVQCVRLLTDYDLNARLSAAGRQTAEQYYDYRQACRPLDEVYQMVVGAS
jgi:glycosyltransferase involved in cell wall biosynthesis